tara:strand:+ start:644 stop:1324 length:681 start_codon:yes stop_codon:yes gene_type:complete
MKLVSFDVGIKNLAYCCIHSEDHSIQDWGIVNISVEPVCDHCLKNGTQCDKTATFMNQDMKLCSTHKKNKQYSDKKWKKIPKCKNSVLEIGKNIVSLLDKIDSLLDAEHIIIENQPALKNPTMKTVQMILYSYFLIRGVTVDECSIQNIEMINARNKLKSYKGPVILHPYEDTKKNKYKINKYLAVKYCEKMIENEKDEYVQYYSSSKKKDDLADAYLQGIYWLTK